MRRGFALAVVVGSLPISMARAFVPPTYASARDLAGTYAFHGTAPDGLPETPGIARLSRLGTNLYLMVQEADDKAQSAARCLLHGELLGCGWNGGSSSEAGCGVLTRRPDGTFEGSMVEVGSLLVAHARLSGAGSSVYSAELFDAGLPRPFGVVNLYQAPRGIFVSFKPPAARGMALLDGDTMFVGFSQTQVAGVVFYKVMGRTLVGKWIDASRGGVGTETLVRL